MPGKGDWGKSAGDYGQGQFFPGEKGYRAWDEGFRARYAIQAAGTNPYDATNAPAEYKAWSDGWSTADANSGGAQYMPATTGAPGALP